MSYPCFFKQLSLFIQKFSLRDSGRAYRGSALSWFALPLRLAQIFQRLWLVPSYEPSFLYVDRSAMRNIFLHASTDPSFLPARGQDMMMLSIASALSLVSSPSHAA